MKFSQLAIMLVIAVSQVLSIPVADPSDAQLKRNSIDGHYGEGGYYGYDVQIPDVKRDDDVFDEGVDIKIVPRADDQA